MKEPGFQVVAHDDGVVGVWDTFHAARVAAQHNANESTKPAVVQRFDVGLRGAIVMTDQVRVEPEVSA